ncbi:MAG: site-specific DNA-methyltransferase [Deltaproteobacteria bacterium]|nr:site-specific DNA-methyltransferase [Deltaproteobacteria bacterium]
MKPVITIHWEDCPQKTGMNTGNFEILDHQLSAGTKGLLFNGDAVKTIEYLKENDIRLDFVYMDPPFGKNKKFTGRNREMEYTDKSPDEILSLLYMVFSGLKGIMNPKGSIVVHLDNVLGASVRLLMDYIFSPENFRNQIIWSYKSGGRATRSYPKKYDILLWYSMNKREWFFNSEESVTESTKCLECGQKLGRNHMKTVALDNNKKVRVIKSAGKTYYYDAEKHPLLTDVWNDISHLHQLDPERTGYPTQKPYNLLKRLLKIHVPPGGAVGDFFCGSGTSLVAASESGFRWIGADINPDACDVAWKRILKIEGESVSEVDRFILR